MIHIGRKPILVVDTPGFDEGSRSEAEILNEISKVLAAQYKLGVTLRGVVYVHRITDMRYGGAAIKAFEIFKRICGETALKNVMLITSMWSKMDEDTGSRKEAELRKRFWPYMLERGSKMSRFYDSRESAIALVSQLLNSIPVVLTLQREIVDAGLKTKDTTAGAYVHDDLETRKREQETILKILLERLKEGFRGNISRRRDVEGDIAATKKNLRLALEQQACLNQCIGDEVDEKISKGLQVREALAKARPYVIPVASLVLNILLGLLGVPSVF